MSLHESKAFKYVESKGWAYRTTSDQIILETCPISGCDGWHFYMAYAAEKDGLYNCLKCGEKGNLYQLRSFLGDKPDKVVSIRDVASQGRQMSPLPNVEASHRRLMAEAETDGEDLAIDYLVNERGFSMEIIERYKLGLDTDFGKRWIVYPYFTKGELVFAKFRSLPPGDKEFRGVSGRPAPLFNGDILVPDLDELLFVEGEADALSCLSNGIDYVVGIPGANLQKASWLDTLDEIAPKKIYLLYDNDKVGQEAAKKMAARIGLDKCVNIVLPETFNDTKIKDPNEFFVAGATLEDFNALKMAAQPFSIDGVFSAGQVVQDIMDKLLRGESLSAKYKSRHEALNRLIGGFDDGDMVGILAEEKIGKSTYALDLLDFLTVEYEEPGFFYCQEMMPHRLVRKWICNVTDTDDANIDVKVVQDALDIAYARKADILFGYTKEISPKEVFETIRQTVRRYGAKFVVFDNLQLLCRSTQYSVQEITAIAKGFKALAMELGIVLFLIIQPHRVQEGQIVSSKNVNGSSAVAKDVDLMLCLHRSRIGAVSKEDFEAMGFLEVEESFGPELLIRADLSRYSKGGTTTLYFDGGKSKILDMPDANLLASRNKVPMNDRIDQLVAA